MNKKLLLVVSLMTIAGCATIPAGPTVMVMPAPAKPFEVFAADDAVCRQFANSQTGINPQQAATQQTVSGAAVGTVVGAAAGAAIGAAAGNAGVGAAAGAGGGLLLGTAVGANTGYGTRFTLQDRYNIAYMQCMYAKGNQVPGVTQKAPMLPPPPPPSSSLPPPPPAPYNPTP
jgi:hypothetical protein